MFDHAGSAVVVKSNKFKADGAGPWHASLPVATASVCFRISPSVPSSPLASHSSHSLWDIGQLLHTLLILWAGLLSIHNFGSFSSGACERVSE